MSATTPTTAMNRAGAAAQRCGWSPNRIDSTANNAQPSAHPSRTIPVWLCSWAGASGAMTRSAAAITPAAIDPATIKPMLLLAACGLAGGSRWLGWLVAGVVVVVIMMAPFCWCWRGGEITH